MDSAQKQRLDAVIRSHSGFLGFIRRHNPDLLRYEHIPLLAGVLQKVVDTFDPAYVYTGGPNYKRVIVLEPPRYFKSELCSRLLPAYFLSRFPDRWAGVVSYGANLAWELNAQARQYYQQETGRLSGISKSVQRWNTPSGGGAWAAGTGGPLLGHGYDLGIPDDPIKPTDAYSATRLRAFEHWFPETFLSRGEPGAAIVFVMQRLGIYDPIGYLFAREAESPQAWHVVCLPEIKTKAVPVIPTTCTLEPDLRAVGDVLAPSRFTQEQVTKKQADAGHRTAQTQRQQNPPRHEGTVWKRLWFEKYAYDVLPEEAVRKEYDWDGAYSLNTSNSATAYIETHEGLENGTKVLYVEDFDFDWRDYDAVVEWGVTLGGPHRVEGKATGLSLVQSWTNRRLAATAQPKSKGKWEMTNGVLHYAEAGRIRVRRRLLPRLLDDDVQGILQFSEDPKTQGDVNDVLVQAVTRRLVSQKRYSRRRTARHA